MVIYLQSRTAIYDSRNRDIMVEGTSVVADGKSKVVLGCYQKEERALEVLGEIFQFIRCKKNSYVMPDK